MLAALITHAPERFGVDPHYSDKVWNQLRLMIAAQLGVEFDRVTKSASFVTDLGCQ